METTPSLSISFSKFYEDYFKDEIGLPPLNVGGGVWFPESLSESDTVEYFQKALKAQANVLPEVPFAMGEMIIDTSISQNLEEGLFLHILPEDNEDDFLIFLKHPDLEWEVISEVDSIDFDSSTNEICINDYCIRTKSKTASFYASRLADCMNAYLGQNNNVIEDVEIISNSVLVDNALDDIDSRIRDIDRKLEELNIGNEAVLSEKINRLLEIAIEIENNEVDFVDRGSEIVSLFNEVQNHVLKIEEDEIELEDAEGIMELLEDVSERITKLAEEVEHAGDDESLMELYESILSTDLTEDMQIDFFNEANDYEKIVLAAHSDLTKTTQEMLYQLYNDDINEVLVSNINLHPDIQSKYVRHCENTYVLSLLAQNESLDSELQFELFAKYDDDEQVLSSLALNPGLLVGLQAVFAEESDYEKYKTYLAQNKGLSELIQAGLLIEDDINIITCLASNPCLTEDLQVLLSQHDDKKVRYALIDNENISNSILELLEEDIENKKRDDIKEYAIYDLFNEFLLKEFGQVEESYDGVYFLDNMLNQVEIDRYFKIVEKLAKFNQSLIAKGKCLEIDELKLVFDTTLFGSLKNGVYIGSRSIAFKGIFSDFQSILLEDVTDISWNESSNSISINYGEDLSLVEKYKRNIAKRFCLMFDNYLVERSKILSGL